MVGLLYNLLSNMVKLFVDECLFGGKLVIRCFCGYKIGVKCVDIVGDFVDALSRGGKKGCIIFDKGVEVSNDVVGIFNGYGL